MHFSADAPIALNALLFIPRRNPEMFGFGRVDANVALYCKRVLIDAPSRKACCRNGSAS